MRTIIQIFIAAVAVVAHYLVASTDASALVFFAILLLGIPHGSLDHVVQRQQSSANSFSLPKFVFLYVRIMAAYLLIWLWSPFHALVIFFIVSMYHFGQEYLEEKSIVVTQPGWYLLWGFMVLGIPFLAHPQEGALYIEYITSINPEIPAESMRWTLMALIICANVLFQIAAYFKGQISSRALLINGLQVAVLALVFIQLPILLSFSVYFIVFHSWNAMSHQYHWIKERQKDYTIFKYLRALIPFTALAYFGVVVLFMIIGWEQWQQMSVYLLIFISLLTLPHLLVFESLYDKAVVID